MLQLCWVCLCSKQQHRPQGKMQITFAGRCVPVTIVWLAPEHGSCNFDICLWYRCANLACKPMVPQWSKGEEPVFLGCCLPCWLKPVSQNLVLSLEMVRGLTPNNAVTLHNTSFHLPCTGLILDGQTWHLSMGGQRCCLVHQHKLNKVANPMLRCQWHTCDWFWGTCQHTPTGRCAGTNVWALPTHLAVFLIPQMTDPYKL